MFLLYLSPGLNIAIADDYRVTCHGIAKGHDLADFVPVGMAAVPVCGDATVEGQCVRFEREQELPPRLGDHPVKAESCFDAHWHTAIRRLSGGQKHLTGQGRRFDQCRTGPLFNGSSRGAAHVDVNAVKSKVNQRFYCGVGLLRSSTPYLSDEGMLFLVIHQPVVHVRIVWCVDLFHVGVLRHQDVRRTAGQNQATEGTVRDSLHGRKH